jgi:hypothetical protein
MARAFTYTRSQSQASLENGEHLFENCLFALLIKLFYCPYFTSSIRSLGKLKTLLSFSEQTQNLSPFIAMPVRL